jgi:hypothetical protein
VIQKFTLLSRNEKGSPYLDIGCQGKCVEFFIIHGSDKAEKKGTENGILQYLSWIKEKYFRKASAFHGMNE